MTSAAQGGRQLDVGAAGLALFAVAVAVQDSLRDDVSAVNHWVSHLALGPHGWIHIVALVLAGGLLVLYSDGLRRLLGPGAWAARWTAVAGLALAASGVFVADPPPGTAYPEQLTWHGAVHDVAGPLTFLSLAAACVATAPLWSRRWGRLAGAGVVAFFLVASALAALDLSDGSASMPSGSAERLGLLCGLAWIVALALHLRRVSPAREGTRPSRRLVGVGALAGALYVGVGTIEAVVRDGFDISRHSLSLLSNGEAGWVHATMMVTTGLLTVAAARGLARSFAPWPRPSWAVAGLTVYGAGVAAAGLLRADPADGFPIGTPEGAPAAVSWHGVGHLAAGGVGFLGLIVACVVLARWFGRRGDRRWSTFSLVTGLCYAVTFAGIASGAGAPVTNIAFTLAVVLGWTWIAAVTLRAGSDRGLRRGSALDVLPS